MDNKLKQPNMPNDEPAPAAVLGYQLRRGFDRLSFEADRLMRSNRIRSEANRLKDQADEKTFQLGRRLIELADSGTPLDSDLQKLVSEIKALETEVIRKRTEVEAVNAETWVAPPTPFVSVAPAVTPTVQKPAALPPPAPPQQAGANGGQPEQPTPSRACPVCHAPVRSQATFCANCGYKLGAA